jgi:peptide chain release factor 1
MKEKLDQIEKRYEELNTLMSQPEVATDRTRLQTLAKERASLDDMVSKYRAYRSTVQKLEETRTMQDQGLDPGMAALVREEVTLLKSKSDQLWEELKLELLPADPHAQRDVIVEIRAGTGGDEAGLFAGELYRMYMRYAQKKGWKVELIDSNESGIGAFKEVTFEIEGKGAFSRLKYERGVHRVQRVPVTESSGRIHTSTATVAVLPKAEEVELEIRPDDLKIDTYRSGGAGGQNVNKVSSAIRLTHLPTGMVVTCQDERSQLRNRQKALAVLRARLLDIEQRKQKDSITQDRRSQVGSGERSEKIRTYNFPQDRLTDHRLNLTLHNLPRLMDGDLDELIDDIGAADKTQQLEAALV